VADVLLRAANVMTSDHRFHISSTIEQSLRDLMRRDAAILREREEPIGESIEERRASRLSPRRGGRDAQA
jgi:hypothetical protein